MPARNCVCWCANEEVTSRPSFRPSEPFASESRNPVFSEGCFPRPCATPHMVQAIIGPADHANPQVHGLLDSGSRAAGALGRNDSRGDEPAFTLQIGSL